MSCGCGCGGEVVAYEDWGEVDVTAAEYQGRKVTLNKPFRTPGANKKFGVYTKNESGNVVLVRFGDPNMEIKRDDPKRRKAFRDRHNCDNPGPKHKARYWSCRQWRGGSKVEAEEGCGCNMNIEAQDPRSTPAPKKDRIKGSPKNKPGSAKPGGKVTFSESVTNSLKNKVKEHNAKSDRKVTLGMLKAVYRRGAGAYSTSHRPGISRAAWSMARVNAFLRLVKSGKPSNPKYKQDNDLLPSSHPRKSKKASFEPCESCGSEGECAEAGECLNANVEAALPKPTGEETHEEFMDRCMGDSKMVDEFGNPRQRAAVCMTQHKGHKFPATGYHDDEENKKKTMARVIRRYAAEPTPKSTETHQEYMDRCTAMGYSKEECMKAHEGHKFKDQDDAHTEEDHKGAGYGMKKKKYAKECKPGEKLVDGECKRVYATIDLEMEDVEAIVEASTGETVIEIRGVAFHEGMNKNKWELTLEGAKNVVQQMIGADVTLNHPKPNTKEAGFSRNTEGLDESTVGVIKSAQLYSTVAGGYEVRYVAHITTPEMFETMESGLYLRDDYGVSIGGSGIPVAATEDGITFGEDFTFDHLALVYRPAYQRANIESIEKIEKEAKAEATFISHSESAEVSKDLVNDMSDENITPEIDYEAQIESLKADLVLASSRVAEFEAAEEARAEDARMALVERATEIGMSGHEDLQPETLENLIASWEASHPEPAEVEMKPVDESPAEMEAPVVASEEERPVVANYLNGKLVESDEGIYARAYNAWASAWNGTLAGDEGNMRAKTYEEIKEMR